MKTRNQDKLFHWLIWAARIGILLLMIAVALSLDSAGTARHQTDVRHQWQERLDELSLRLQSTILQNIQTVWGLAANVAVQPDIDEQRFRELASVIFRLAPELRNIGLAPDFVIRHIYPLEGNESALGLDLTAKSLSPEQIRRMLVNRQVVYSGPIDLVQGGQGLAGRIPIFESQTGEFWGVTSVILDLDRLYHTAGLVPFADDMTFGLSTSEDPADRAAMFLGTEPATWHNPVTTSLNMPGTRWTLFAEPDTGWPNHPESPLLVRGLLTLMVLLVTSGTFWLTSLMLKDRKMQRRFKGLFELAPIGIGLYSAHRGELLQANRAFERSFGKAAQSLDYFDNAFDQDGKLRTAGPGIRDTLKKNFRFSGLEGYFPNPEQQMVPVMLQGLQLDSHDSESVIWLITEDISEQKKVDRLKSEFISTVSHELRTPLTSISGSLGLLANNAAGELPESASRLAQIAYRNSRQLTMLINDLLDIEKLAAGKMPFKLGDHTLPELVRECVENIEPFARERQVQIHTGELAGATVRVDRQRFDQAATNLLSNAIKFSPEGASVEVFTEQQGDRIRLCVRDYGEGVPQGFREQIFQKFSQADGSDRRAKGGTGLGLAITRELMANMNGKVDYRSTPGEGALFWLELPAASLVMRDQAD
ncbi:sensor histidine kinase [Marinobacter sp. F4206]|uniref:sensor histidine kinase n=1 Tax=Marinobacter sp. F4206 TaxID=2861777 RepID=UPI001C5F2B39|nr:ATP-binding protein [Marinobacter sp. F4206]MBW4934765.1 CHASE domain-containing protein [Marinobacter sp. F4206]